MPLSPNTKYRVTTRGNKMIRLAIKGGKVIEAKVIKSTKGATKRRTPPDPLDI